MILVVARDHNGLRAIEAFDNEEIAAVREMADLWRVGGLAVRVVTVDSMHDALESFPQLFRRTV